MTLKEEILKNTGINEGLLMTIMHPILSGEGIRMFEKELRRWKEIGFISKWKKNRFFSEITIYIEGIHSPYVIDIKGMLPYNKAEGETRKEKLKSLYYGKIKSPYRSFKSFNQVGFYEIMEKFFDTLEEDVTKGKPQEELNLDDKEADKWEREFMKKLKTAKSKVNVFRQIDKGNFDVKVGMNVNEL